MERTSEDTKEIVISIFGLLKKDRTSLGRISDDVPIFIKNIGKNDGKRFGNVISESFRIIYFSICFYIYFF